VSERWRNQKRLPEQAAVRVDREAGAYFRAVASRQKMQVLALLSRKTIEQAETIPTQDE
jgi:hypothetical protein